MEHCSKPIVSRYRYRAPKELREEDGTRVLTKQKVDAILDAFDWGEEADVE